MNTNTLRLNGYTVDNAGRIELQREGERFEQERTAVIRIDLKDDSKPGRALAEQLIAAADTPRAIVGRSRNGSAVLLFRRTIERDVTKVNREIVPGIQGYETDNGIFALVLRESGDRVTISVTDTGAFDPDAYTWAKGRSPVDVTRDSLPELTQDVGALVVEAAQKMCVSIETYEREQAHAARMTKFHADVAAGRIKVPTIEDAEAAADEALAASMGPGIRSTDGSLAANVLAARARIEHRARTLLRKVVG